MNAVGLLVTYNIENQSVQRNGDSSYVERTIIVINGDCSCLYDLPPAEVHQGKEKEPSSCDQIVIYESDVETHRLSRFQNKL